MIELHKTDEWQALRKFKKSRCVTIYVPYMDANAATNPMQIALKDALKDAKTQLKALGTDEKIIKKTLRLGRTLAANADTFWPHYHESLVLFLHADLALSYWMSVDISVMDVHVGYGFDLRPIADMLANNKSFAVLVLDHRATQFYVGDRFHLAPAPLPGFPADMKQTLNIDEYPKSRELHEIAPAYLGKGSEGYHGQYNVSEVDKQMLTKFFRMIDRRLHHYLTNNRLPLVIAGVSYLLPLYRAVNTYAGLVRGELHGSFRRVRLDKLHGRAWAELSAA